MNHSVTQARSSLRRVPAAGEPTKFRGHIHDFAARCVVLEEDVSLPLAVHQFLESRHVPDRIEVGVALRHVATALPHADRLA
jgi:hypothetical protein